MRAVSHQHVPEGHSVGTCTIRIGATLEQEQGVRVGETIVETHCRSVKKQRITGRIRSVRGHRGIDVSAVIKEQLKSRSRLICVVTQVPVHENNGAAKFIASIRISARVEHRAKNRCRSMHSIRHCEGVSISVCVIRVCAERKQCFNGVDCFQVLPRSPDSKVEQCGAVSSGCLQIRHVLCRSTDGLRIVSHDTLCDRTANSAG